VSRSLVTDELTTQRLTLVPVTRSMADAILRQQTLGLIWPSDYTTLNVPAQPLIDSLIKCAGMHLLVEKDAGEVIGHTRFEADGQQPEVIWLSYAVADSHRCRGYATEGVGAQVKWLREQPQVQVIKGEVIDPTNNRGSVRVLEKLGFTAISPTTWQL
jgi:hypothetical protein